MKRETNRVSLIQKENSLHTCLLFAFLILMIISQDALSEGLNDAIYITDDPVFLDREEQCFENGCFQDLDGDNINDEQEELLAYHFRPYLSFDPYDNARSYLEPVVLYQVNPADPNEILISVEENDEETGYNICRKQNYQASSGLCHGIYIKYFMYFALDGGPQPETHDGYKLRQLPSLRYRLLTIMAEI